MQLRHATMCFAPFTQGFLLTSTFKVLTGVFGLQGADVTFEVRMPQEEVAISQLAVLENFSQHGVYVKFDNGEAAELEEQALQHALRESAAAAEAASRNGCADMWTVSLAVPSPYRKCSPA